MYGEDKFDGTFHSCKLPIAMVTKIMNYVEHDICLNICMIYYVLSFLPIHDSFGAKCFIFKWKRINLFYKSTKINMF